MIKGHGDDIHMKKTSIKANFSSNTWFGGVHMKLIDHLKDNISVIQNYPEPDAAELKNTISNFYGMSENQVFICNGSVDAFYHIAQVFQASNSAILIPSFSEYEDACKMFGHEVSYMKVEELENTNLHDYQLVWIGNPNNPDGKITPKEKLTSLLLKYPNIIFVIDEAYGDLAFGFESLISEINNFENCIVCASLTKTYAIPGLRLGYFFIPHKYINSFKDTQKPWAINSLAIEAGKFIFENQEKIKPDLEYQYYLCKELQEEINLMPGFQVITSQTCFFLVKMDAYKASELKQYLIHKHGILIRDASNFQGLDQRYFRISVQSKSKNQLLVKAIQDWQNSVKHG